MPVDFFTVAVHEIGHSLGLSHSPDHNSIMFPYYKGKEDADNFDIGYDDILAMFELYGESRHSELKGFDAEHFEVDNRNLA